MSPGPATVALRRVASAIATLVLVSAVVFGLIHLTPGDAVSAADDTLAASHMSSARADQVRAIYRLDLPVHRQYVLWLADVARGELGRSFHDRRPVADKIAERLGITVTLNVLALAVMLAVAVPLGAWSALHPGSRFDRRSATLAYLLFSIPVFWAALVLQTAFAVRLDWLPLHGLASDAAASHGAVVRLSDRIAHLILPVTCLSYGGIAYLARFVRANLLENELFEAARAARARGLSVGRIVLRHGFRQAAVPLLTLAGFVLPALLGGSVIVERIFSIPGLGMLFYEAVLQRDVPVIMAMTLLSAVATLAGILMADVLYAVLDPRVRHG